MTYISGLVFFLQLERQSRDHWILIVKHQVRAPRSDTPVGDNATEPALQITLNRLS